MIDPSRPVDPREERINRLRQWARGVSATAQAEEAERIRSSSPFSRGAISAITLGHQEGAELPDDASLLDKAAYAGGYLVGSVPAAVVTGVGTRTAIGGIGTLLGRRSAGSKVAAAARYLTETPSSVRQFAAQNVVEGVGFSAATEPFRRLEEGEDRLTSVGLNTGAGALIDAGIGALLGRYAGPVRAAGSTLIPPERRLPPGPRITPPPRAVDVGMVPVGERPPVVDADAFESPVGQPMPVRGRVERAVEEPIPPPRVRTEPGTAYAAAERRANLLRAEDRLAEDEARLMGELEVRQRLGEAPAAPRVLDPEGQPARAIEPEPEIEIPPPPLRARGAATEALRRIDAAPRALPPGIAGETFQEPTLPAPFTGEAPRQEPMLLGPDGNPVRRVEPDDPRLRRARELEAERRAEEARIPPPARRAPSRAEAPRAEAPAAERPEAVAPRFKSQAADRYAVEAMASENPREVFGILTNAATDTKVAPREKQDLLMFLQQRLEELGGSGGAPALAEGPDLPPPGTVDPSEPPAPRRRREPASERPVDPTLTPEYVQRLKEGSDRMAEAQRAGRERTLASSEAQGGVALIEQASAEARTRYPDAKKDDWRIREFTRGAQAAQRGSDLLPDEPDPFKAGYEWRRSQPESTPQPREEVIPSRQEADAPAGKRDRIVAAAVRDPATGKFYTGATHGDAMEAAKEAGLSGRIPYDEDYFLTESGRYVDRKEAARIAGSHGFGGGYDEGESALMEELIELDADLGEGSIIPRADEIEEIRAEALRRAESSAAPERVERGTEPERIAGPSIRYVVNGEAKQIDGTVGETHADLVRRMAIAEGLAAEGDEMVSAIDQIYDRAVDFHLDDGFVTSGGRFVFKPEATEIARANRQARLPEGETLVAEALTEARSTSAPQMRAENRPSEDPAADFVQREDFYTEPSSGAPRAPEKASAKLETGYRIGGQDGGETSVAFPDGQRVQARYRVVEADRIQPSHNPQSFQPNPRYPEEVQGRDYHRDTAAQERITERTQKFDAARVLDPTEEVGAGPPLIAPDGTAIAGNERSILLQRVLQMRPEAYGVYREALEKAAERFGLDPESIRGMQNPVLVREVADESIDLSDRATLRDLNRRSDIPVGKVKDPLSDAKSRAARMRDDPQALQHLADTMQEGQTLRDYLRSGDGKRFVQLLEESHVIDRGELAAFRDARSGVLTDQGADAIERTIQVAAVGDPDVIAVAPKALLNQLEHAYPAIVRASASPEWDMRGTLQDALRLHAELKGQPTEANIRSIKDLVAGEQQAMFARNDDPSAVTLARFLEDPPRAEGEGVTAKTAIKNAFHRYAKEAEIARRQGETEDLFGFEPKTPGQVFDEVFGGSRRMDQSTREPCR